MKIYPDSSFVIPLFTDQQQSDQARLLWTRLLADGQVEILQPALVEKELDTDTWQAFNNSHGAAKFTRGPTRSRWAVIKCGEINPASGVTMKAGDRHQATNRSIRSGDSFQNDAQSDLASIFRILARKRDSKRHRTDDDDIRHLLQAAEWECDVFLHCETRGKIGSLRLEIMAALSKHYKRPIEVVGVEELLERLATSPSELAL